MRFDVLTLCYKLRAVLSEEDGQDLVEYALVVALIALAATVGMGNLATAISNGFTAIGTTVTTSV